MFAPYTKVSLSLRLVKTAYLPLKFYQTGEVFICQESYEEFKELPKLLCSLKLVFCSEGGIC